MALGLALLALNLFVGTRVAAAPGLEWTHARGYRSAPLSVPSTGRTYLQRLSPTATGVWFTNVVSEEKGLENSLRTSGAGVAAGDVDGDGWCDLYFCGMENSNGLYRNLGQWRFEDVAAAAGVACAGQYSTGAVLADLDGDGDLDLLVNSLGGGTRLFLSDSRGRFTESTEPGLSRKFGATSAALADIDGNGTLDLYVANYATTKIEDRPNAKFDAQRVGNELVLTAIDGLPMTSPELTNRYFVDAARVVRERGEADILYRNVGQARFRPVSWTDGSFLDDRGQPLSQPPYDFGLAVIFRDMDGDLAPDLYICNDLFPPDRIWVNDKHGRFRAMSNLAVRHTSRFSMGVDFADIDRDGNDDFFVVDMLSRRHPHRKMQVVGVEPLFLPIGQIEDRPQYKRNTLFLARGDGTYAEIAQFSGLEASEWSWTPVFLDVDLDGFEDVLVTTGHERDSLNGDAVAEILRARSGRKLSDAEHRALKKRFYPVLKLTNQAFRNRGNLTFEDVARAWGFDYLGISQGICLADLDHDGDLDVLVNHLNDGSGIYRNESAAPRVAVQLKGKPPNTRGVGAKIKLLGGAVPQQQQEMVCGGRYLSSDDTLRVFAAGALTNAMTIEITWRSGARSVVTGVKANHIYEIDEIEAIQSSTSNLQRPTSGLGTDNATSVTNAGRSNASTLQPFNAVTFFQDVSHLLQHSHFDAPFDDFERQPLLTRRLSQLGPGVSWFDVDGDDSEDLIIGSGVGGRLAIYRNKVPGGFQKWDQPPLDQTVNRDQTTILGWSRTNGQRLLLIGSSNYEDGVPQGSCVRQLDLDRKTISDQLPPWECSTGPMAMADWNGDGTVDLFVGGRVLPGRYPEEPFSLFFRGTGMDWVLDQQNVKQVLHAGLVSGAVFSDLDADGDPDLVLACDWGPLRIYRNDQGRFVSWDWRVILDQQSSVTHFPSPILLSQLAGWWNGVAAGDFDGDGRLDLIASNWGGNTRYQSHRQQPLRLYYGDWLGNRSLLGLEAYFDDQMQQVVPWCTMAVGTKAMPWMLERFATHAAFGTASVADLLGERINSAKVAQAVWLETTLFLNRGETFTAKLLPLQAQFAPAFGLIVGDMDGDGNEDVFLSQNFFAVDGDTSRYDAGCGLWLAGDGQGNFRAVSGQESGVKVYGEQRGCALSDYDSDGRVDFVVTQNGAGTKLYRNTRAKPGVRVRLQGPPGNPLGLGATLRLMAGGKAGPAREIQAGSGYWSQNSAVQVLCSREPPSHLQVRWPGGRTTTTALPARAQEVVVDTTGQLLRSR